MLKHSEATFTTLKGLRTLLGAAQPCSKKPGNTILDYMLSDPCPAFFLLIATTSNKNF
jgi:hypothetical protein